MVKVKFNLPVLYIVSTLAGVKVTSTHFKTVDIVYKIGLNPGSVRVDTDRWIKEKHCKLDGRCLRD